MKIQLTEKAAEILLALTALIWGSGFVCYKNLMSLLTPIQFVVVRSFFSAVCAGLFFLCVIRRASRREWLGGFLLGGILAAAGLVQTYGIRITSSGNCAFLTGTNVVMVPFLSWALTKKKPGRSNLFSALMMFAGVCLLTVDFNNITAVNAGDLLSFLGAFLYAVHIAVTGKLRHGEAEGGDLSAVSGFVYCKSFVCSAGGNALYNTAGCSSSGRIPGHCFNIYRAYPPDHLSGKGRQHESSRASEPGGGIWEHIQRNSSGGAVPASCTGRFCAYFFINSAVADRRTRQERTGPGVVRLWLSLPSPAEGCREGESGRNELLRGPFALLTPTNSARLLHLKIVFH